MKSIICQLRDEGETLFGIARRLDEMGFASRRGGRRWSTSAIERMFELIGESRPRPYHANYIPKGERNAHSGTSELTSTPVDGAG